MGTHLPSATRRPSPARHQALQQYRARADRYDSELEPFEPLRREAIQRLDLRPGETVLDVGCGTGLSFGPLLDQLGPTGHIVGIEQCPEMMARARLRLIDQRAQQLRLVQAPVEEAQWPGQAHAALFHFTHDILRNPRALDNVLAHLAPGARVVATGLQWAAPWVWPVNLFVLGAALYSVSSLDGLAQPWSELAPRLTRFEVQPTWMGGIFMASGVWPGQQP
ncbi:class I SAM-dependent DNA methyltransferase [Hydrogenophaga flava]|uniref:class I SAM-dependent DNA methyltransferase n=1 Tax=Hydrogenophaga flava TaxID=65657 RepID=UPI000A6712BE|nr:class I SAM-dependent methyltransferase [Hydrogenophaga flava]